MPNPLKGEVSLGLADHELVLVLDHEALIEAEAAYGKPLAHLMADATLGFAGACRSLLYGALRAHHPTITLKEAATLFLENMEEVSAALAEAAEAAFPKSAEGKQGANPPRAGTNSGRSGAKPGSTRTSSTERRRKSTKSKSVRG